MTHNHHSYVSHRHYQRFPWHLLRSDLCQERHSRVRTCTYLAETLTSNFLRSLTSLSFVAAQCSDEEKEYVIVSLIILVYFWRSKNNATSDVSAHINLDVYIIFFTVLMEQGETLLHNFTQKQRRVTVAFRLLEADSCYRRRPLVTKVNNGAPICVKWCTAAV